MNITIFNIFCFIGFFLWWLMLQHKQLVIFKTVQKKLLRFAGAQELPRFHLLYRHLHSFSLGTGGGAPSGGGYFRALVGGGSANNNGTAERSVGCFTNYLSPCHFPYDTSVARFRLRPYARGVTSDSRFTLMVVCASVPPVRSMSLARQCDKVLHKSCQGLVFIGTNVGIQQNFNYPDKFGRDPIRFTKYTDNWITMEKKFLTKSRNC